MPKFWGLVFRVYPGGNVRLMGFMGIKEGYLLGFGFRGTPPNKRKNKNTSMHIYIYTPFYLCLYTVIGTKTIQIIVLKT